MTSSRWLEITPSPFPHELEGLNRVRAILPDHAPYRAWSNFEFRDGQGKWHEVDLLVLGRRRLHLVELKYYSGTLKGDDHLWRRDGHRAETSPLKLARRKAQRLASKLQDELLRFSRETGQPIPDVREVVPFVQEAVYLHHPGMKCDLPPSAQIDLYGVDGGEHLPGISERLLEPPTDRQAIGGNRDEILTALMQRIGVVQRRQREAGSWVIDEEPLADGDGWQDWPAFHRVATTDRGRIRFFVTTPGASVAEQQRVRRVAEHEYRVMSRLAHDGLLKPKDLVDDELGIGLVYPDDNRYQRLDLWCRRSGDVSRRFIGTSPDGQQCPEIGQGTFLCPRARQCRDPKRPPVVGDRLQSPHSRAWGGQCWGATDDALACRRCLTMGRTRTGRPIRSPHGSRPHGGCHGIC